MNHAVKDFRVTINIRNNQLCERRERLGYSQQQMADAIGVHQSEYSRYESLLEKPLHRYTGRLRKAARKIVDYFGESPEVLWSEEIRAVKNNTLVKKFSGEQARDLVGAYTVRTALPPDRALEDQEFRQRLRHVLQTRLTPQEAGLLGLRFGLTGKPSVDVHEAAYAMGLHVDVIRTIERRALDKLRAAPVMAELLQVINLPVSAAMLKHIEGLAGFLEAPQVLNSYKPWTSEEDKIIRDKSLSSNEVCHKLDRTLKAVRNRCGVLGVRRREHKKGKS